jgi:hypothetical protein
MIEPRWIEKWDYEFPNHFKEFLEVQTDWNQTLLTKVNLVSAEIHVNTLRGPADTLEMNLDVFELIKTLAYYNSETNSIDRRYSVKLNDDLGDEILVYSSKYSLIPVFIAFCEKGDSVYNDDGELETELKNIHYKPSTEFTNEELIEHQNKLFGKIEILNYKKP